MEPNHATPVNTFKKPYMKQADALYRNIWLETLNEKRNSGKKAATPNFFKNKEIKRVQVS